QHPVRPLPPVDHLELIEGHAGIALAVLRNSLVFLELDLPSRSRERRHDAGHRLPLHDRKAGFGEPGRSTHDQSHKYQRRNGKQPQPHGAAVALRWLGDFWHYLAKTEHWLATA